MSMQGHFRVVGKIGLRAAQAEQRGANGASVARYACNLVLTVYPGRQLKFTTADITRLTRDDMAVLWKVSM